MNALVDFLNDVGNRWAAWMLTALLDSTVLLALAGLVWLAIRRRVAPQLGYWLFVIVVLKLLSPVSLPVPHSVAHLTPSAWALPWLREAGAEKVPSAPAATLDASPANLTVDASRIPHTGRSARPVSAETNEANEVLPTAASKLLPAAPMANRPQLSLAAALMIGWFGLVALLFAWMLSRQCRFHARVRRLLPIERSRLGLDLSELCRRVGVRQGIRVVESDSIDAPAVWGILRPTIILPRDITSSFTPEHLQWVLLHELAHVRRLDLVAAAAERCAAVLYFFHPVVWIVNRVIDRLREYACDDFAVAHSGGSITDSADIFLRVLRFANRPSALTGALGMFGMGARAACFRRVRRLLDADRPMAARLNPLAAAGLLAVALATLPYLRAADKADQPAGQASLEEATRPGNQVTKSKLAEAKTILDGQTVTNGLRANSAASDVHRLRCRVVDDKGKAVVGARVRVYRYYLSIGPELSPDREWLADTLSDASGRCATVFRPLTSEAEAQARSRSFIPSIGLLATAEGFGFCLHDTGPADSDEVGLVPNSSLSDEVELRLAPDSSPIEGRITDSDGRPVRGARVTVRTVALFNDEPEALSDWLAEVRSNDADDELVIEPPMSDKMVECDSFLHLFPTLTTDDDGRFAIAGVGADRVAYLEIEGAQLASTWLPVVTRPIEHLAMPTALSPGLLRFATQTCYGAHCNIVAPPEQPIRGMVRDAQTGRPLEGVDVRFNDGFYPLAVETGLSTKTGADGRYEIRGLPKPTRGDQKVDLRAVPARGQPYFPTTVMAPRQAGLAAVTCDVSLRRAVALHGQITDRKTGKPVRGAVRYYPFLTNPFAKEFPHFLLGVHELGYDDHYHTDDVGRFFLPAAPGRGVLTVVAEYGDRYTLADGADAIADLLLPEGRPNVYQLWSLAEDNAIREVDIPRDAQEFAMDVRLAPLPVIPLLLVDQDGNELRGVETQGLAPMNPFASGWFHRWREPLPTASTELFGPEPGQDRETLFLDRARNLGAMVRFTSIDIGVPTKQIVLRPCGSVRGRIVDGSGKGLAGASVFATVVPSEGTSTQDGNPANSSARKTAWLLTSDPVPAAADGRFELKGVPPGARYAVKAVAENRSEQWQAVTAEIEPGAAVELGDLSPAEAN